MVNSKQNKPINKNKVRKDLQPHKLEDYEPGATRDEVLQFIKKVALSPKTSKKHNPQ